MSRNILNIAHRGASEYLPDNSFASFDRAIAENADMIELDVRKTADGKIVLFHDWYIRPDKINLPDFDIPKLISHITYSELKKMYQAKGFELILLEEILEHYKDSIYLNIELKAGGYEKDVVDLIRDFKLFDRVIVSSFFPWVIKKVKDINNQVRTGWIIGQEQVILLNRLARPVVSLLFKKIEADSAHLHYEIVTPAVVKHFHDRQAPVYAWTVNDNEVMKRLIDTNVDGVITDRPAVLNSALQREPHDESFIQIPGVMLATSGENR